MEGIYDKDDDLLAELVVDLGACLEGIYDRPLRPFRSVEVDLGACLEGIYDHPAFKPPLASR